MSFPLKTIRTGGLSPSGKSPHSPEHQKAPDTSACGTAHARARAEDKALPLSGVFLYAYSTFSTIQHQETP